MIFPLFSTFLLPPLFPLLFFLFIILRFEFSICFCIICFVYFFLFSSNTGRKCNGKQSFKTLERKIKCGETTRIFVGGGGIQLLHLAFSFTFSPPPHFSLSSYLPFTHWLAVYPVLSFYLRLYLMHKIVIL